MKTRWISLALIFFLLIPVSAGLKQLPERQNISAFNPRLLAPEDSPASEMAKILRETRKGAEKYVGPKKVSIYVKGNVGLPNRVASTTSEIVKIVANRYPKWPEEGKSVSVYVLSYGEYLEVGEKLFKQLVRAGVLRGKSARISLTRGFFLPTNSLGEYAIFMWGRYSAYTTLHELVHCALMEQTNLDLALNHDAVNSETLNIFLTDEFQNLMKKATRR